MSQRASPVALDAFDLSAVGTHADVWEQVVRKLRSGTMPPVGARRPDRTTYDRLATWFEGELDRAAALSPNPGRPSLRPLNRAEYGNNISDLLELEIDSTRLLPPDDSAFGFDNIADLLVVSPAG